MCEIDKNNEDVHVPGVERPTWDEISKGLEQLLTPKEEDIQHES
ncbi:hypothetical protein [Trichlorobacter lovleyi]|nr:hypothetical protein [Trichlorobacter lovleyi]